MLHALIGKNLQVGKGYLHLKQEQQNAFTSFLVPISSFLKFINLTYICLVLLEGFQINI